MRFIYEDAKTLYEGFQHGKKASSESITVVNYCIVHFSRLIFLFIIIHGCSAHCIQMMDLVLVAESLKTILMSG